MFTRPGQLWGFSTSPVQLRSATAQIFILFWSLMLIQFVTLLQACSSFFSPTAALEATTMWVEASRPWLGVWRERGILEQERVLLLLRHKYICKKLSSPTPRSCFLIFSVFPDRCSRCLLHLPLNRGTHPNRNLPRRKSEGWHSGRASHDGTPCCILHKPTSDLNTVS